MEDKKEVVLSGKVFRYMINHIKKLEKANQALNEQVRKYNEYAREQNELEKD